MFVVSNFFSALANVVDIVLNVLFWLIFIRAVISWVNPDPYNQIVQFLERVTEPVLAPIRRMFPPMAIDISPLIVCLVIFFLRKFLVPTLYDIGFSVR
jgi:YggT family protein